VKCIVRILAFPRRLKLCLLWDHDPHHDAWVASDDFLRSPEWRRVRYDVLEKNDGRCECCGRNKHQLPPGDYLCVDHIFPRKTHPWLALEPSNLQILCSDENAGKGNRYATDWRAR
jgi:5-methylcytosine-specific restriction endonuclease McrA